MSNILTYPGIPIVAGGDMMIISDVSVDGNPTRSVSVNQLGAYIGAGGGSGAGVTSFNTLVGALTLVGGTDITLGTVGNTITINSAAGGGTVTSLSTTVAGNSMFATVTNATTTPNIAFTYRGAATQYINGLGALSLLNTIPTNITLAVTRTTGAATLTGNSLDIPNYTYNANEIGFFINRHPATSAIEMMWKADDTNIGSTTFSIAEEGTITGAFIITASSNYWQASYRLTMDINVPVYYDIGGKQVVKTAYCKRIAPNKLQIEFFQETSSTAEILQRVDLVVADTSSQGVSPFNGIDLRVKRWFFGM
jgi:hypothetical protein